HDDERREDQRVGDRHDEHQHRGGAPPPLESPHRDGERQPGQRIGDEQADGVLRRRLQAQHREPLVHHHHEPPGHQQPDERQRRHSDRLTRERTTIEPNSSELAMPELWPSPPRRRERYVDNVPSYSPATRATTLSVEA